MEYMKAYLNSIGSSRFISKPVGKMLEMFAEAGFLPRNVLSVYGRAI
jgi:hypothetical protein